MRCFGGRKMPKRAFNMHSADEAKTWGSEYIESPEPSSNLFHFQTLQFGQAREASAGTAMKTFKLFWITTCFLALSTHGNGTCSSLSQSTALFEEFYRSTTYFLEYVHGDCNTSYKSYKNCESKLRLVLMAFSND